MAVAERPKASVLGATPAGIRLAAALHGRFGPVAVWEPDPDVGRPARGAQGIASVSADLPGTVRQAAVVAFAVRRPYLTEALEAAGPCLAHGAIVLICTIGHETAHAEATRLLPTHVSVACVTMFPPPPEEASRDRRDGILAATAGISLAPGAHPDAVSVVHAITEATGAAPFFGDAREIDGFAAATLAMPAVLAASAIRVSIGLRSSRDLDRAGGGPLALLTSVVESDVPAPEELSAIGEHLAKLLDALAEDLHVVSTGIRDGTVHDGAAVASAADRRRTWLAARAKPADAITVEDGPKPARRRLFF